MSSSITRNLLILISLTFAVFYQLSSKDIPAYRDFFLQQLLSRDLKELSLNIQSNKETSSKSQLGSLLKNIESKYQRYPRVGSQLVLLYWNLGHISQAQSYLEKMTYNMESLSTGEKIFILSFSLEFYKKNQYPELLINSVQRSLDKIVNSELIMS